MQLTPLLTLTFAALAMANTIPAEVCSSPPTPVSS